MIRSPRAVTVSPFPGSMYSTVCIRLLDSATSLVTGAIPINFRFVYLGSLSRSSNTYDAEKRAPNGQYLQVPVAMHLRSVSYRHLRAHETDCYLVCRLL